MSPPKFGPSRDHTLRDVSLIPDAETVLPGVADSAAFSSGACHGIIGKTQQAGEVSVWIEKFVYA